MRDFLVRLLITVLHLLGIALGVLGTLEFFCNQWDRSVASWAFAALTVWGAGELASQMADIRAMEQLYADLLTLLADGK